MENNEICTRVENKKRIVYFDVLNILAMISVVAMHCNGLVHGSPNIKAWNTSLIVECICYWAVPVFVMLSGANLMNYRKKYSTKEFFKKRMLKVLIPFIFWAIFMFVWKKATGRIKIELSSFKDYANFFLNNGEESTYYFIFEILGVYLTMPLLSRLAKEEYRATLWLTVVLFFLFNATIPNILGIFGINWNTGFGVKIGNYSIYVILGYLLSTQDLNKKQKYTIYIGAIIGLVFRYLTTFFFSKKAGITIKTTWGYASWHCMLLSMAIFISGKNLKIDILNKKIVTQILAEMSKCSLGIYLIHMFVRYYEVKLLNINTASWQFRTFGVILTYVISLVIVYILKKIPVVKKIVP